jgi:hypothetical protein
MKFSLKRNATCWILVATAATLMVAIGVLGEHIAPPVNGQSGILATVAFWLLGPGYLVAALLAALFLPGGGHSVGELFWVGAPVSWIFYFLIGTLIFCVQWNE